MRIHKNIFSVLGILGYFVLSVYACFEVSYLTVYNSSDANSVGGVIVLGAVILLIGAYFVKEGGYADFFEANTRVAKFAEVILVIGVLVAFAAVQLVSFDIKSSAIFSITLFLTYLAARLSGGRLCGFFATVFGWVIFQSFSVTVIPVRGFVEVSLFLAVYCAFVIVTRYMAAVAKHTYVMVVAYLLLAVFSSACTLYDPMIFVLIIAEILVLMSGNGRVARQTKDRSLFFVSGLKSMLLFLLFLILSYIGIYVLMCVVNGSELTQVAAYKNYFTLTVEGLDKFLMQKEPGKVFTYILSKSNDFLEFFYIPFASGVIPSFILFFAVASGWFSLRRELSYLSSAMCAFLAFFIIYLLFAVKGDQFQIFYFLLPVFSGYGISNLFVEYPNREERELGKEESEEGIVVMEEDLLLDSSQEEEADRVIPHDNYEHQEVAVAKASGNSLSALLERLDLTENIRRMSSSAQEDMADVIEKTTCSDMGEKSVPAEDLYVMGEKREVSSDNTICESNEKKEVKPDILLFTGQEAAGLEYFTDFTVPLSQEVSSVDSLILPEVDEGELVPDIDGEAEVFTVEQITKQAEEQGGIEGEMQEEEFQWIMEDEKVNTISNERGKTERKYYRVLIR